MRYVRSFGAFWYDFLVGDRWELFLGPLAALFVAWLLTNAGLPAAASGLILFGLVAAVGALSIAWSLRAVSRSGHFVTSRSDDESPAGRDAAEEPLGPGEPAVEVPG